MSEEYVIEVVNVSKRFKVYPDKGKTLKEKLLFRKRRKYENRQVLSDISFNVRKGESLGLIGHNGCGKSTTLKLLSKIMYPDNGQIVTRGRVSSLIELGAGFHPDMTGRQNIYINASIFGLSKKEIEARISNIIKFSELEKYIDNPVRTYSSGMYMRLAFSIAINVDADILLIDEILAVGDANFQTKCFERLREIKATGVTIVIVSHDLGSIERFCDTTIWLDSGKIAREGKSGEVIDKYLQFMNQKRLDNETKEERNIVDDTISNNVELTIKKEKEKEKEVGRVGNRFVEIIDVKIRNISYTNNVVKSDEDIFVDIYYKKYTHIDKPIFGIGIFTLEGTRIFGTNTQIDKYEINECLDEGKVTIRLINANLLTGKYSLQVAITDQNGTLVDFHRDYLHFDVISNRRTVGIIDIEHEWKGN